MYTQITEHYIPIKYDVRDHSMIYIKDTVK